MSYDLFLLSDLGDEMRKQVYDFFAARPNYEVSANDIAYENPETGVHFQWFFLPFLKDKTNDGDQPVHEHEIGHLRLNFCRPTAFSKEAAIELIALSNALPVKFYDLPQQLIYERFSVAEQLTVPYLKHVQKAFSAFHALEDDVVMVQEQPKHALDAIWEWNFNRKAFANSLEEDLFVPKINFFRFDGELKTGIVWGDGVSMICPPVDIVVISRSGIASATSSSCRQKSRVDVLLFEEFKETYADWFSPDTRVPKAVSCSPSDTISLAGAVASNPVLREISLQEEGGKHSIKVVPFMDVLDTEICSSTMTESALLLFSSNDDQVRD